MAKIVSLAVTVTTPGTAVPISATPLDVAWVYLQAKLANLGDIYIGGSNVSSANGITLEAPVAGTTPDIFPVDAQNSSIPLDLGELYIDSENAAEGVNVVYGIK